ncbi:MAG: transporter [Bacteroidales bacterium]|jgi:putative transport protein|nr:transporter [Bacteroidales bacterium]
MELLLSPYFSLFLIIILGYTLGAINIRGIGLGVSAVLFVAMVFGYYGLVIPQDFKQVGLVLFIFTIGFQAGPSFFETFRKDGKKLLILAFVIVVSSAIVSVICGYSFGFSGELTGGLFAGAITSTPGLAAITELSHSNEATIGYGLSYPFGVIGVVIFIKFLPRLFNMDIKKAEENYNENLNIKYPKVLSRNFIVENEHVYGKSIAELELRKKTGANISRVLQNGCASTPHSHTILEKGAIIRAVGTAEDLSKVQELLGPPTELHISLGSDYNVKYIVVTNKKVLNKTLSKLDLQNKYNVVITRIKRSGLEFCASPDIKIQFADKLKVVGTKEDIDKLSELIGDEANKVYEANYIPVALGIVLGILLGKLKLEIGEFELSLGLTGGVMTVAIIMGRLRKVGPVVFSVTGAANSILRQIGLLLFLASVGAEAGSNLVEILKENGLKLFFSGVLITLIPMIIGVFLSKFFLKIDVLQLLGGIAGGMTSTPGLAVATSMTKANSPGVAYTTIYPIAMILVILCVQIIYMIL